MSLTQLFPDAADPDRAPSLLRLLGELATPAQLLRLLRHRTSLASAPRAKDGSVVLTIPGWFTPEATMSPLRRYLRWLGHDARGWGMGHNTSDVVGKVRALVPVVRDLAETHGAPVLLVGWSLGGLVARETARDAPDAIARIVTIGAPAVGGPRWTHARHFYTSGAVARHEAIANARDRFPIAVPVTSIVTRRDGVIDWRAQLDRRSAEVRHVEVRSTHGGMAVDPDVWMATAEVLAALPVEEPSVVGSSAA